MNNGRVQNMQYRHSPSGGFTNVQQNSQQSWGSPATGGWGAPARGYSPSPTHRGGGMQQGQFVSPGSQKFSSRNNSFNTPGSQNFSPRHNFNFRYHSPNDGNFRTPHSPFSPPGSHGSGRGRGNGRKSFNKQFGQTPRRDHNCNPGGSSKIEDYYHPSMLEDPWKYCTPVPASQSPMAVT